MTDETKRVTREDADRLISALDFDPDSPLSWRVDRWFDALPADPPAWGTGLYDQGETGLRQPKPASADVSAFDIITAEERRESTSADVDAAREALLSTQRGYNARKPMVDAFEAAIRAESEATIKSLEQRMAGYMLDAAAIRAEGLDVERLEGALAKYGIHIDINRERKHEVPCESCQAALRKVAAEYARLAKDAER